MTQIAVQPDGHVSVVLKGDGLAASRLAESGETTQLVSETGGAVSVSPDDLLAVYQHPWGSLTAPTRLVRVHGTDPAMDLGAAPNALYGSDDGAWIASLWPIWARWWLDVPAPNGAEAAALDPGTRVSVWRVLLDDNTHQLQIYDGAGALMGTLRTGGNCTYARLRHSRLLYVVDGRWQCVDLPGLVPVARPVLCRPEDQCYNPVPIWLAGVWWITYNLDQPKGGVCHPWDSLTGYRYSVDREPWGLDARGLAGGVSAHSWAAGSGERPGEGQILKRLTTSNLVYLPDVLTAPLVLPEFPATNHPMYVLVFGRDDAADRIVGPEGPWAPARARFHTLGRDNLAQAIADCRTHNVPLFAYVDSRGYLPTDVPVIDGVRVVATVQCYPKRPGRDVGPMQPTDEGRAEVRATLARLAAAGHEIAIVGPWYDQSGNWPRQIVLDWQRIAFDLAIEFRAVAICPFIWQRTGTGVTDVPIFRASLERLIAAIPHPSAAAPHEDAMPYSLDNLIEFAFGNAYLQLIDFTKTHPDFRTIPNDRVRVFAALRWIWAEWSRVVAHPNAEGFGTAVRQWPTGESFLHLAQRMGLELRK